MMSQEDREIINEALKILKRYVRKGSSIESLKAATHYLQLRLSEHHHELFGCIFLDNRHRVICHEDMFFGSIDGATIHPRVVVKRALEVNAAAVLLYHNHPSGVAEPSQADKRITERLIDALALVDVRVLDHLVVGAEEVTSFAERGLI